MIFGATPLAEAEGALLAHALSLDGRTFKKGRRLSAEDLAALAAAGHRQVVAARLEPGDVHEDAAAAAIAAALAGPHLGASAAFTGRCNLIAAARGLLVVDRARLDRLNRIDEAVTVATQAPFAAVESRQMTATVKIIPFAVPGRVLERCLATAGEAGPLLRVAPFAARRAGLVQTRLPGLKESLLDKTRAALDARLAALGCPPAVETRCAHRPEAVARALAALSGGGSDLLLISGASAIVDRRDVVPAGLVAAGGRIAHFGMPVDPGNLMLLGRLAETPVIGLPGCARSPKLNGFDWVLRRLVAGLEVGPGEVMAMGAGGLLKEIPLRPLPRAVAVATAPDIAEAGRRAPKIAGLLLAAGRATRMGGPNKLLAEVGGRPMVAASLAGLRASRAAPIVVVTGHQAEAVATALGGPWEPEAPVILAHNPDFAAGLSTSLHRGLAALPEDAAGAVIALADMPQISAAVIDRLIAAFDPPEGRAICLPTWRGKRGNPVLLARRFFAEIQAIAGDVGARALIGDYPEWVAEVAMDDLPDGQGVLRDIDTPEALAALAQGPAPS